MPVGTISKVSWICEDIPDLGEKIPHDQTLGFTTLQLMTRTCQMSASNKWIAHGVEVFGKQLKMPFWKKGQRQGEEEEQEEEEEEEKEKEKEQQQQQQQQQQQEAEQAEQEKGGPLLCIH